MSRSPNRLFATIVGACYLVAAVCGFVVGAGHGFFAPTGGLLLGVQVNGLHNLVHLAVGGALLGAGLAGARAAKTANGVIGALCLLLGLVGLFLIGSESNVLALNGAGNVVHFGTSIVLLAVSLGAEQPVRAKKPARGATR